MSAATTTPAMSVAARPMFRSTVSWRSVVVGVLVMVGYLLSVVAVAGVVAFTASELVDATVDSRLRRRSRLSAVAVSNAVGLVVDSLLFVPLTFGTEAAVPGQSVGKAIATILTIAAQHSTTKRRRAVWP